MVFAFAAAVARHGTVLAWEQPASVALALRLPRADGAKETARPCPVLTRSPTPTTCQG